VGEHGAVISLIGCRLLLPRHIEIRFADDLIKPGKPCIRKQALVRSQEARLAVFPEDRLRQIINHQLQHRATLAQLAAQLMQGADVIGDRRGALHRPLVIVVQRN